MSVKRFKVGMHGNKYNMQTVHAVLMARTWNIMLVALPKKLCLWALMLNIDVDGMG